MDKTKAGYEFGTYYLLPSRDTKLIDLAPLLASGWKFLNKDLRQPIILIKKR
jgi:hypothetical protein